VHGGHDVFLVLFRENSTHGQSSKHVLPLELGQGLSFPGGRGGDDTVNCAKP
jgi:hypothetical protein